MPNQAYLSDQTCARPVIDLDHLATFTEGDRALENELAALYVATARDYLKQMQDAVAGGGGWSAAAHALKGASGNLGARRVAALALAAEKSSPDAARLAPLHAAIEEVEVFFARRPG